MARINSLTNFLDDVATAIKQKTGDNTPIPASEFDTEILSIEVAGTYQQKTLTITQNGQTTLTPDTGFDAMDQVAITVNVPIKQLQSKTVSVTSNGNVTLLPDTGYDGFNEVNLQVNVPTIDTSDATATSNDIVENKTAYVNGQKITGTISERRNTQYLIPIGRDTTIQNQPRGQRVVAESKVVDNGSSYVIDSTNKAQIPMPYADVASAIGLTAEKIVSGNTILGIEGTGGSTINNQDKTITQNGQYTADSGYTGLGEVTVNVPSGSGDVKLFETIADMQADADPEDGDLAVVYNTGLSDLTATTEFQKATFPKTVVLSSATSGTRAIEFRIDPTNSNNRLRGNLTRYEFYLSGYGSLRAYDIEYTSNNGLTYTLDTVNGQRVSSDTIVDFGATLKFYSSSSSSAWRDAFGKFIQITTGEFDGLFQYSSSLQNYVIPITQLSAIPENVYGDIFIGKQGVEQGTLNVTTNLSKEQILHRVTIYDSMSNLTPINDITNMAGLFAGSSNLVNLPSIDLSNVTDVSGMFESCNNLSDKSLSTIANMMPIASQINNSLVYNIGITSNRFSQVDKEILFNKGYLDCNQNTEGWSNQYIINGTPLDKGEDYDIYGNTLRQALRTTYTNASSINVSGTGDLFLLASEFSGCNAVLVNISNLDTSKVYSTRYMFYNCGNLKSSPDFNTSNVTDMSYMFYNCVNLTSVSDYDTSNVTNMSDMFSRCVNLTTQPNFDTSNVVDMSSMFYNCHNLTSVNNLDGSNATDMSSMFDNCVGLRSVSNLIIGNRAGVAWMFVGCNHLQSVSNLTVGATNLHYMFNGCSNLVNAPDFNASNVINMYSMFDNCTNLQNVPEYDVSNLKSLERTFGNCNKLSDASIQNIINMCLNSNISIYKNLMPNVYSSPFSGTNITNTRYQNRWTELSEAGWTY